MAGSVDFKYISVAKLRELLADKPDDWVVWPNGVGNLTLYRLDNPAQVDEITVLDEVDGAEMMGYIDVHGGEYYSQ